MSWASSTRSLRVEGDDRRIVEEHLFRFRLADVALDQADFVVRSAPLISGMACSNKVSWERRYKMRNSSCRIDESGSHEPPTQRKERLVHERMLLEEARREFRDGLILDKNEVDAWLDGLDSDEHHLPPEPQYCQKHRG
jgi:hypothetical protein